MTFDELLDALPAPSAARLKRGEVIAAEVTPATPRNRAFVGVHPLPEGRFRVAQIEIDADRLGFDLTPESYAQDTEVELDAARLGDHLEELVDLRQLRSPARVGYPG